MKNDGKAEGEAIRKEAVVAANAGRDVEALQLLQRVLDSDPGNAKAWINRTQLLLRGGECDAAVVAGRRAIELAPDQIPAWSEYGRALESAGEQEAAVEAVHRALAIE